MVDTLFVGGERSRSLMLFEALPSTTNIGVVHFFTFFNRKYDVIYIFLMAFDGVCALRPYKS